MRAQLDAAITVGGLPKFTASFGLTEAEPGEELVAVLRRADDALLQAKQDGRDRVVLHDPGSVVRAEDEEAELDAALPPLLDGRVPTANRV